MKYCLYCIALLALPAVAEPVLEFTAPTSTARPGEAYALDLRVTWTGDASDVVVLPPEIGNIDWGDVQLGTTTSGGAEGAWFVSHRIEVVPAEAGDFEMPEITVPYSIDKMEALGGAAPGDVPHILQTDVFLVHVRPDRTGLYLAGGVLAIALIGSALVLLRRRAARNAADARLSALTPKERVQALLHDARRHRLDGNYYLYYVVLAQAAEMLGELGGDPALAEKLSARSQEVGYQGSRPTDDEMDGALREFERALAQSKETSLT